MWLFRPKEIRQMFLGGTISLSSPIPRTKFLKAITEAWCLLRLKHPEIACSVGREDSGYRYMRYQLPSAEELKDWATKTVHIETSESVFQFSDARRGVCQIKDSENCACLYLLLEASKGSYDFTGRIGFVFNMDHMYTDGIGARILAGQFFQILSGVLASAEKDFDTEEFDWSKRESNLSAPYTSLMNEDQKIEGKFYALALDRQRKFLLELVVCKPSHPDADYISLIPPSQKIGVFQSS